MGLIFPIGLLAQTTDPTDNTQAPFVLNIRSDRPGRTITTSMLALGQVQLEAGTNRWEPAIQRELGTRRLRSTATLRIGLPNHIELALTRGYLHPTDRRATPGSVPAGSHFEAPALPFPALPSGFAPLTVGAKFLAPCPMPVPRWSC